MNRVRPDPRGLPEATTASPEVTYFRTRWRALAWLRLRDEPRPRHRTTTADTPGPGPEVSLLLQGAVGIAERETLQPLDRLRRPRGLELREAVERCRAARRVLVHPLPPADPPQRSFPAFLRRRRTIRPTRPSVKVRHEGRIRHTAREAAQEAGPRDTCNAQAMGLPTGVDQEERKTCEVPRTPRRRQVPTVAVAPLRNANSADLRKLGRQPTEIARPGRTQSNLAGLGSHERPVHEHRITASTPVPVGIVIRDAKEGDPLVLRRPADAGPRRGDRRLASIDQRVHIKASPSNASSRRLILGQDAWKHGRPLENLHRALRHVVRDPTRYHPVGVMKTVQDGHTLHRRT